MSTCDAALLHVQQDCKCEWNRLMFSHQCSQIKVWPNRTEKCVFQETAGQSHLDLWPPNSDHLICKNQVSASSANVRYFLRHFMHVYPWERKQHVSVQSRMCCGVEAWKWLSYWPFGVIKSILRSGFLIYFHTYLDPGYRGNSTGFCIINKFVDLQNNQYKSCSLRK